MLKRYTLLLHSYIGLCAAIVLLIMGVTGGLYSFQHELVALLHPEITQISEAAATAQQRLRPSEIMQGLTTQLSQADIESVSSISLNNQPLQAARIGFMKSTGGKQNFEMQYINPYTGTLLGKPASEDIFRKVLDLHRKLGLAETGKSITGASTLALVFLLLSGLLYRFLNQLKQLKQSEPGKRGLHYWFGLDTSLSKRDFLSNLHAVSGSYLILCYLLAALTGLSWSYGWYRNGLKAMLGSSAIHSSSKTTESAGKVLNLDLVWDNLPSKVKAYQEMILLLPKKPAQPMQILYTDAESAHPYANNRIVLDGSTGQILSHEKYADKPFSEKFMSSLYALHSGSIFGLPGRILMMLSAFLLAGFSITGVWMYLKRKFSR